MELVLGLTIGLVLGFFCTLIPNFNIGLGYLLVSLIPNGRFAIGLVIGVDISSSSISHLSLLHSKHRKDLHNTITQSINKNELMYTAVFSYYLVKATWLVTLALAIVTQGTKILDIELIRQLSVCIGVSLWLLLIWSSKYWKVATIAFIFYIFFTLIIINLPIQQPIILITSSLFSVNFINDFIYKPEIINNTSFHSPSEFKLSGFWAGLISAFFWGLPTNPLCRLFQEKEESPSSIVSRHAIADAVSSSTGLAIFLTLGGSRTAAASTLSSFNEVFSNSEIFWLLTTLATFNCLLLFWWQELVSIYVFIHNHTPHFLIRLSIVSTILTLTVFSQGWFIITLIMSLLLRNIITVSKAPNELSLSPLGILPLVNLLFL